MAGAFAFSQYLIKWVLIAARLSTILKVAEQEKEVAMKHVEGRMWDLILSVPDHWLSVCFIWSWVKCG